MTWKMMIAWAGSALLMSSTGHAQVTTRVSLGSNGTEGASWSGAGSISPDGRYVAFYSQAANLVEPDFNQASDIFVRDRLLGSTERVSVDSAGILGNDWSWDPSITPDGRFVAFWSRASNLVPGDSNGSADIFVRDRQSGTTERVNSARPVGRDEMRQRLDVQVHLRRRPVRGILQLRIHLVAGDSNGVRISSFATV